MPGRRRTGLGSAALRALREVLPAGAGPLHGRTASGSPGEHFAGAHGMAVMQRSRTVRVALPGAEPSPGVEVRSDVDDDTVGAWRDYYARWPFALQPPESEGPRFVGGALRRDDPNARSIAQRLLASAASVTGGRLDIEVDDWMTELRAVVDPLPYDVTDEIGVVAAHP